jgi:hypothetical protein
VRAASAIQCYLLVHVDKGRCSAACGRSDCFKHYNSSRTASLAPSSAACGFVSCWRGIRPQVRLHEVTW